MFQLKIRVMVYKTSNKLPYLQGSNSNDNVLNSFSNWCPLLTSYILIPKVLYKLFIMETKWYLLYKCNVDTKMLSKFIRIFSSEASSLALKNSDVSQGQKWVGRWLFGCSGMVFGAVVIGGLTRLTESGLSMTDWHLFGKRPPLTEEEWNKEFSQYKEFPEYKLNESIRTSNLFGGWNIVTDSGEELLVPFFLIPASYFWYKGWFSKGLKKRVVAFGGLILLQGLMGWYMVKSGLDEKNFQEPSDVPRVSQYRLMTHLGAAFVLYTLFLWSALDITYPAQKIKQITDSSMKFRKFAHVTKGFIFFTALSGALVAGLDAGLIYNSFPKMANRWIPTDLLTISPVLRNFTENPTTVQFDHRILGTTVLLLATAGRYLVPKVITSSKSSQGCINTCKHGLDAGWSWNMYITILCTNMACSDASIGFTSYSDVRRLVKSRIKIPEIFNVRGYKY
ncbi:Cytochrome c oxidase assembly protein COX15-like protein [Armadillidium nasatum]|uniref:Cytochrome c oxidase assembly protein COX15-like protein n=2 Tax=Armadillidium nasatum TaxID=96803 RepID=A0A5N5SSE8_9CRUS|nr:Cytochrome c oxidase assembly protein COX15-like protein [Armadillidium nasatum]